MGSNRRYPSEPRSELVAKKPTGLPAYEPMSLSDAELDVDHHPITEAPEPLAVHAWVRYPETAVRADAHVLAWTDRAVFVEWTASEGTTMQAWVWSSAVESKK